MSDDEVANEDDEAAGESAEVPTSVAEPVGDEPSDADDAASVTPSPDEVGDAEKPQDDEAAGASEPDTDQEQSAAVPESDAPPEDPAAVTKQWFEVHYQPSDEQHNKETSPPHDEHVTFRAVTLAELYVGPQVDVLSKTLRGTEWVDDDEQYADEIATARQNDDYYSSEFLLSSGPTPIWSPQGYGKVILPDGIHRILGKLYVLGPSMVGLVLTFVLADDEAGRLEKTLREYVKAELRRPSPGMFRPKSVYEKKHEGVRAVVDEVGTRCVAWLQKWAPGTLGVGDGLGVPLGSLIGLVQGKPFEREHDAATWPPERYLRLLDLVGSFGAFRFDRPDYLFLNSRSSRRSREFLAAFNETEASESHQPPSVAPEVFHQTIYAYMLVLAMEGILISFESRMRASRSGLAGFDFDKAVEPLPLSERLQRWLPNKRAEDKHAEEPRIERLRNHLLVLSRDIAIVCGDIKGTIDNNVAVSLWADYPLLIPVEPSLSRPPAQDPARVPRKNLTELMGNIKGQETELRELVLVTSQAVGERQGENREKVLNKLTWVLVFLTVAVLVVALIPLFHSSSGDSSNSTPTPSTSVNSP